MRFLVKKNHTLTAIKGGQDFDRVPLIYLYPDSAALSGQVATVDIEAEYIVPEGKTLWDFLEADVEEEYITSNVLPYLEVIAPALGYLSYLQKFWVLRLATGGKNVQLGDIKLLAELLQLTRTQACTELKRILVLAARQLNFQVANLTHLWDDRKLWTACPEQILDKLNFSG